MEDLSNEIIDDQGFEEHTNLRPLREQINDLPPFEFGAYFSHAKKLYSKIMGPTIGYALLAAVISMIAAVIPILGNFSRLFLTNHLSAGFYIYIRNVDKKGSSEFGEFFGGFRHYVNILLFNLLMMLIIGIPVAILIVIFIFSAGIDAGFMGGSPDPEMIGMWIIRYIWIFLVLIVGITVVSIFLSATMMLIVLRKSTALEAVKYSFKFGAKRFWNLLGIMIVLGLINIGGVIALGVGILFTIPFTLAVTYAWFEHQIGVEENS